MGTVMVGEHYSIQCAAREAISQLHRHAPRARNNSLFYDPSQFSYGGEVHIAYPEDEQDPALENLVCYLAIQESLLTRLPRKSIGQEEQLNYFHKWGIVSNH